MPKNMSEFLIMMDERLWFRMIVCFLPPLIIVKLSGYTDESAVLNKFSTGVLLLGVAVYVFWARLRGWSVPTTDDALQETEASAATQLADEFIVDQHGREQSEMLAELRGLCRETERESDRLIAMELAVNPQLSYAEATRNAITRKRITDK